MNKISFFPLLTTLVLFLVSPSFADTQITSITADPAVVNPYTQEVTTITVLGTPGVTSLVIRVLSSDGATVVHEGLPLVEASEGVYAVSWDGKSSSGSLVMAGEYQLRVYNLATTTFMGPGRAITVMGLGLDAPNPFVPTGNNAVTFTMQAAPGQTGLKLQFRNNNNFYWRGSDGTTYLPLTETSTSGVYTAEWDAVNYSWQQVDGQNQYFPDSIIPDGYYFIYVYDSAGNQSTTSGTVTISGVASINAAPTQLNPSGGELTTLTAKGATGLNLKMRIVQGSPNTSPRITINELDMAELQPGVYTTQWDGRNTAGEFAAVGSYYLEAVHANSTVPYYPRWNTVQISVGTSAIVSSENPFKPTGSNNTVITVNAAPGQTGLKLQFRNNNNFYWRGSDGTTYLPLTETSTSGVYTAEWDAVNYSWQQVDGQNQYFPDSIIPDGYYFIYVYDSAGNQSTTNGTVTITGVASISAAPTQFNPSGSELTMLTANGAAGLNLKMRIVQGSPNTSPRITINELDMAELQPGVYTTQWDGRNIAGEFAAVGSYYLEAVHTESTVPYYPRYTTVQISVGTSAIASSENPFKPTGANSTVITVNAVPGQTGLKLRFSGASTWYDSVGSQYLPLTETSTPGVYTAEWNAVNHSREYVDGKYQWIPFILRDGNYTIYVHDSVNNQSATTGTVTITGVASLTVSPAPFTPGGDNYATITAKAAFGMDLETRVFNNVTNAPVVILPLVEASGTYTAEWDGKDRYGNFAGANTYRFEIYHANSTVRYYPMRNLAVNVAVFAISATPNPFVPTGQNFATLTVRADAGQSGLTASITHPTSGSTERFPLLETGSEGTYTGQWDGTINGIILKGGVCTIRIYDQSGNQFPATGTLTLSSAKSLTFEPNPFEATGENTATVTAEMAPGLNLEARIGDIRTLPLAEAEGLYTAAWDGKTSKGGLAPTGAYTLTLWNRDTGVRYDLQTAITVKIVDTVPPETTITTGPGEQAQVGATTVTFNWTGTDNLPAELAYATKVDDGQWSDFTSATSQTLNNLSEGVHTFSVKAKDAAGNEDASPAIRHFAVDITPPVAPAELPASSTDTGIQLSWTGSSSSDVYAYHIYWNGGSGEIDYSKPYAVVLAPAIQYTVAIIQEGDYQFTLRAVDKAGNETTVSTPTASVTITGFTLTVAPESPTYDRGQEVPLSGTALLQTGEPIADLPVLLDVESKGYHRQFTAYTDAAGAYRFNFHPRSDEAGSYTVKASSMHQGLGKSATASFDILGLLLQPADLSLEMSMNSSKTVKFDLKNIGSLQLNGLAFELIDHSPDDGITGSIDDSELATTLEPGGGLEVPVTITAPDGTVPEITPVFSLKATTTEGSTESVVLTAKLHEAAGEPVITPNPLKMSVGREISSTRLMTLTNEGFAPMSATTLNLHDPAAFPWVVIVNPDLGTLEPAAKREVQVNFNPPADLAYGNYVIPLDLAFNGTVQTLELVVELTAATTGKVAFTVYDDTGSLLPGAEVNLISKEMYVNTTPQGTEEYPNVIKGKTDDDGYLLLENINPGEYRYVIYAERHDPLKGEITVEPGDTPLAKEVVMVTNLVDVKFEVSKTTIADQYAVTLNITYATDLTKPTLYADPSSVHLSFFPEEVHEGTITITNTSNNAPVRNLTLNAAALDPIDNEVQITFDNGSQVISLVEELGPKQSRIFAFKAAIPNAATAKLNPRKLGNIQVTGEYTFSINGEARESTTTTPIPVLFSRPQDLALPAITFVNDETDGDMDDLEFKGTTYRLSVRSNRTLPCILEEPVQAISHINGGPDAASILTGNTPFWETGFNNGTLLQTKGDQTTFDITGLEDALEGRMRLDRTLFLKTPHFLGFRGSWSDRQVPDAYLVPVSIVTIRPAGVSVCSPFGGGGLGGWTPPRFNEHGEVKLQIEQKVSLEREAFDADLELTPSVSALQNVDLTLSIKDQNGDDASGLFFVAVTQKTGLSSLDQGVMSGPAKISWQLIPSSSAGGTTAEGQLYEISASMSYAYDGKQYTYATAAETVTVKPMPKLTLDYYLPYVVMAGKPVKIRVDVANGSAGAANHLVIASGQPKIVENVNNIPVSFSIDGSSASSDPADYQAGKLDIDFGEVAAGGSESGYWQLTSTRNGYFVEFSADLKHENYLGMELDPLVQAVNTHFVPAVGGKITQGGCMMAGSVTVEVWQNGDRVDFDVADSSSGNYFISDLAPGDYQLVTKDSSGRELSSQPITILDGQPTAAINLTVGDENVDTDQDGLSDCWEMYYWGNLDQGPNDDFDQDGLLNIKEFELGTHPKNADTDGDGISDFDEVNHGTSPVNPDTDGDGIPDGDDPDPLTPSGAHQEFTLLELASLAWNAYADDPVNPYCADYDENGFEIEGSCIPDGFERLPANYGDLYYATVPYKRDDDIVIAFKGTTTFLVDFLVADLGYGPIPDVGLENYLKSAAEYVRKVADENKGSRIILTGHSLGGGIAQLIGNASGCKTITFNSAGALMSVESTKNELVSVNSLCGESPNIQHYRINGDPVSLLTLQIEPTYITTIESPKGKPDLITGFNDEKDLLSIKYYHVIETIYEAIKLKSPATDGIPDFNLISSLVAGLNTILTGTDTVLNGVKIFNHWVLGDDVPNWIDPPSASGYVFDSGSGPLFRSVALPLRNDDESYSIYILDNSKWVLFDTVKEAIWYTLPYPSKTFAIGNWPDYGSTITGFILGLKFSASGIFDGSISPFETFSSFSRPTANAGPDQMVRIGEAVELKGNGTDLVEGPEPLTYKWSQTGGSSVALEGADSSAATFTADLPGVYTFSFSAFDGETWSDPDSVTVTVVDSAPLVTIDQASQSVQYSDEIASVTITAEDEDSDSLTLTTTSDLPSNLVTAGGCTSAGNGTYCSWTLEGQILSAAGNYPITFKVSDENNTVSTSTEIIVTPEDATVIFDQDNLVAVPVSEAGGVSSPFKLTIYVNETIPDQAKSDALSGDIQLANASVSLVPVTSGSNVVPLACSTTSEGIDYNATKTLNCDFSEVPVNVYTVNVTITGNYYLNGGEDLLTVYDPSLGLATGGGWFYWPGTEDKTNFGFTMKYDKKGTNPKGGFLLIRHLDDGTIYRVKSNALEGLAIGKNKTVPFGWASFTGKSTYLESEWEEPIGNCLFTVYTEDRNEPGTGIDRIWLSIDDGDGYPETLSLGKPSELHAQPLGGGNIVVPH